MAAPAITFLTINNGTGTKGTQRFAVAASATTIKSGDPVIRTLGNTTGNVVAPAATNGPVVGTDYIVGIAAGDSTNTASAAGTVDVYPVNPSDVLLIAPKVAATWDTTAEYNALVGARVLLDLTSGVYTILATDGATSGCVVQPLDISLYPGKVAFSFRAGVNPLA